MGLWNGKDLSNWDADVPTRDADPSLPESFVVRGGLLVSLGKPEGHLITKQAYRDYRLVAGALGDTVTVWVNGVLVTRGHGATGSQGLIAVQAEGTEVEFRRIEIGPLTKQCAR